MATWIKIHDCDIFSLPSCSYVLCHRPINTMCTTKCPQTPWTTHVNNSLLQLRKRNIMKPFVFSGGERTPQIESSLRLFPLCKGLLMDAGCLTLRYICFLPYHCRWGKNFPLSAQQRFLCCNGSFLLHMN